jgi:hypothetical protein
VHSARFVALDTMNLWIDIARESLLKTSGCVDCPDRATTARSAARPD